MPTHPTGGCPGMIEQKSGRLFAEARPRPQPAVGPRQDLLDRPVQRPRRLHGRGIGLRAVWVGSGRIGQSGTLSTSATSWFRQRLFINKETAAATSVSDPFPTFIYPQGPRRGQVNKRRFPIKLRRVNFAINRPGFIFNPTNCSKLGVTGAISSTQGGPVSNLK